MIVYSIHDINGQPDNDVIVNSTSGHVISSVAFDRESRDRYEFLVTASDQGRPLSRSSSVLVRLEISDVNDEQPTFAYGVYTFGTYENQPSGTEVGTVVAVDRDLAPYNEVEYHLKHGGGGAFEIGRRTGRITATRPLDRETESEYHLTVVTSQPGSEDAGTGSSTARVKVVVADRNDIRPKFVFPAVANDSITVAMCDARQVTRIVAEDGDIGVNADLRYHLLSDQSGVEYQLFDVNPRSGVVTARRELSDGVEYPLHIQVRDTGTPPLVADTWLGVVANCSRSAALRGPDADVTNLSHLGGMLVVVVMAAIASALLLVCILAASVVLRHCIATSGTSLRTDSKTEPDPVTVDTGAPANSRNGDEPTLKLATRCMTSSTWYPPRYSAHETTSLQPHRSTSSSVCSSVERVRPVIDSRSSHVTPKGRSQQVPVTSLLSDDVRHYLLYGANIWPPKYQAGENYTCLL